MASGLHQDRLDKESEIMVSRAAPSTDTPAEITRDAAPGSTAEGPTAGGSWISHYKGGTVAAVVAVLALGAAFLHPKSGKMFDREIAGFKKLVAGDSERACREASRLAQKGDVDGALDRLQSANTQESWELKHRILFVAGRDTEARACMEEIAPDVRDASCLAALKEKSMLEDALVEHVKAVKSLSPQHFAIGQDVIESKIKPMLRQLGSNEAAIERYLRDQGLGGYLDHPRPGEAPDKAAMPD